MSPPRSDQPHDQPHDQPLGEPHGQPRGEHRDESREDGMDEQLDRQLDDQLRAAFAPPPDESLVGPARAVVAAATRPPAWPWLLAAAAGLLVTAAWLLSRPHLGPEGHDAQQLGRLWAAAYQHAVSSGFGGSACCEPAFDLAGACKAKFATELGVNPGTVRLLGCYCGLPTGGCMALLARDGTTPVGIYIVPAADDPLPRLPADCAVHLTRREMGAIVLYAISQAEVGDALAQFFVPNN